MLRTFLLFALWSIRNGLRVKLRRLRQPRYLVGALVGVGWLAMVLIGQGTGARRTGQARSSSPVAGLFEHPESAQFFITLGLLGLALFVALRPGRRSPLTFSSAEVQLLFPAPLSRRQLVHYKLLRSQGALLIGSLVMTLIWRSASFAQAWTFYLGLWIGLTAFRLWSIGAGLASLSVASHGSSGLRRRWMFAAVIIGALAVLAAVAAADGPRLAQAIAEGQHWEELRRIWSTGVARAVLWPFTAIARPALSGSGAAFVSALPGALLVVLAGYLWVIRSDAAFEEAAAVQAEKRAKTPEVKTASPRRARRTPFHLALRGRPETAILWKNLISVGRGSWVKILFLGLPALFFILLGARSGGARLPFAIAAALVTAAGMTAIMGPLILRADLRRDLGKLAILKSWPLPGMAIVRGELLAPVLVLSTVICAFILGAALLLGTVPVQSGKLVSLFAHLTSYAAAGMLATPGVILAQLVGMNALALLFPAWFPPDKGPEQQNPEMAGPMLIVMIGGLLAAALMLVPAVAGAALAMAGLRAVTRTDAIVVPAAVLSAIVVAEFMLVSRWLGRVFDRTDLGSTD